MTFVCVVPLKPFRSDKSEQSQPNIKQTGMQMFSAEKPISFIHPTWIWKTQIMPSCELRVPSILRLSQYYNLSKNNLYFAAIPHLFKITIPTAGEKTIRSAWQRSSYHTVTAHTSIRIVLHIGASHPPSTLERTHGVNDLYPISHENRPTHCNLN